MRKSRIQPDIQNNSVADHQFLDLEKLAQVEFTSEDAANPIESAFTADTSFGWKAAQPGEQTIRLRFDKPQHIRSIHLLFREEEKARTQEFLLRYSSDNEQSYRNILRQQFNFSPPDTILEKETYTLHLQDVHLFEIVIIPDISGGDALASIAILQFS